ncbi:MAG: hypothetical protein IK099_02565 [Clostridia bacterium]|nr:hypothetical protein [Clostridia bacterium]
MEEKRIPVYGKDAEDKEKRAFDWIVVNGRPYMETKDRSGHKVLTPAKDAIAAYKKLQQPGNVPA